MAAATTKSPEASVIKQLSDKIDKSLANQEIIQKRMDELSKPIRPGLGGLFGIRHGEDPMTSRGYSYLKLFGALGGKIPWDQVRVEKDLHERICKAYFDAGMKREENASALSPACSRYMTDVVGEQFADEVRQISKAGVGGWDANEVFEYKKKYYGVEKALSWLDETTGGALVAPPQMGELIELLRNNDALIAAGARDIGMPPNGRITFPSQKGATTAYFIGESTTITDSTPATGDLLLTAKKLAVLCKIPNELFRFSSVSVEQFVRDDIARVMALRLDKACLEDPGSSVAPKGLINYANINSVTATGTTSNPNDTLQPEDLYSMIAAVEEVNAIFKSWILRPLMYQKIATRRADAAVPGDGAGPFLFDILRELGKDMNLARGKTGALVGYPAVKSTNVSKTRGTIAAPLTASTNTYILGGDFSDFIIALGGVIEFVQSTQGDTPLTQDQTWIRGIQHVDCGPRHEASFVKCDNLKMV